MGVGNSIFTAESILEDSQSYEELQCFLNGEDMEEERIVNLLKFSIKPIKSAREENDFTNACQLLKTETEKVRNLGDKKCSNL